ncbi:hypothetical protein PFICI_03400 [Pestalotiopsis fici W106-1]|uniref:Uncharacterized protein n=1 Tax=Pestalotiopsis fici (strain W106-1 / CGMCC3.15140) TaxID=1229662 RepID=W3XH64_PESFW|nr:uncharacterized protein PFICI_03400 [Pestalotiopsis fici W106-1]ETS85375.1 hypothetical protein PFICI_03400 [Pestalotiopsis fici W106-1]
MPGLFQSFFEALQKSNHRHGVGPPPGTRLFGKSGSKKVSKDDSKKGYKTWHFCAYKGCKSQSEAYAKGRNYGFLASPYCSDHACRHWDHGQPCKNPTKRDEPLCDIHGCVKDGCKNQKEIKSASLNSKYCLKHTCVEADCLEMSDSALNRCEKHTCAFATCLEPVTPGDDAVTKYCARHRQCKAATCNQDVQLSDGRGPLPYCKDHYCAFGHDCDEPRHGTSTACEKHICRAKSTNAPGSRLRQPSPDIAFTISAASIYRQPIVLARETNRKEAIATSMNGVLRLVVIISAL